MSEQSLKNRGRGGHKDGSAKQTSPAEWAIAVIAALLVFGAIAKVLTEGISGSDSAPALTAVVDSVSGAGNGYRVDFTIRNEGGTTAAAVSVHGALLDDSTTVEESDVVLDYVPTNSQRSGGLFFTRDPARYRLEIRPTGYEVP